MNTKSSLLTAFVLLCAAWLPAAASERAETLRAINWVENPTNHTRRGSKGELGPYQFRSETWRMHTHKSFSQAIIREHADEIAVLHYEWLKRGLSQAGIDPSPYNIAMAWNSGLASVINGRVPMVTYNYAERVHNLVELQRVQKRRSGNAQMARAGTAVQSAPRQPSFELGATVVTYHPPSATSRFVLPEAPATVTVIEPTVFTDKTPVVSTAVAAVGADKPLFTPGAAFTLHFALLP